MLTRETRQRITPSALAAPPLDCLPVPKGCRESISTYLMFGLPNYLYGNAGIMVFVECFSKMDHLPAVSDTFDGKGTDTLYIDRVF